MDCIRGATAEMIDFICLHDVSRYLDRSATQICVYRCYTDMRLNRIYRYLFLSAIHTSGFIGHTDMCFRLMHRYLGLSTIQISVLKFVIMHIGIPALHTYLALSVTQASGYPIYTEICFHGIHRYMF